MPWPSLDALHDKGVKLYLASGTDQQDVEKEADALGYAELFDGRIYGASASITKEPKKIVLEKILKDINEENTSPNRDFRRWPGRNT